MGFAIWSSISVGDPGPNDDRPHSALGIRTCGSSATIAEIFKAKEDTDDQAFEELIAFRAAHWLAAFDIVDADRGSLTGQKTDDDGTKAERVRRTVNNSLMACVSSAGGPSVFLREIASSMDEEDRRPRKVDNQGKPYDGLATRTWFNRTFPKEDGTRSFKRLSEGGAADAAPLPGTERPNENGTDPTRIDPVEETPKQAAGRLAQDLGKGVGDVKSLARDLNELVAQLNDQAKEAGMDHPLSEQADAAALGLTHSLGVFRELPEQIQSMAKPE
ncbi:hypothetical protein [Streptomyces phytophilus]|uniref:hypothetical protein n=1 Tax=Streptomyces phytophilus TaxID=722715 RepID=UPI0015F108F2|nr:hypothetical protein [Streptomyces phytophilus]